MQTLSQSQAQQSAGGMLWSTPAMVAIMDSGCFGPLAGAFGAGYVVGTFIYNNFISE